jgi:hypothetical protein
MAASQHHQPPNQSKVGVLIGNENEPSSRRCDTPPGFPRYGSQPAISTSTASLPPGAAVAPGPPCACSAKPAARYQRNHGNRFGEFGLCGSHRVRCWPGELCDYQRSSRNSNRHEWIDGACNHNDSARPSGCALDHADRHHLLNGLSAVARWKHGFIWG